MHKFTIGIEEEYQIIDAESRDLVSHVSKIIESGKAILSENLKHEMHESMVEMETGICQNVAQARDELTSLRRQLVKLHTIRDFVFQAEEHTLSLTGRITLLPKPNVTTKL